jgi:hypothetical protein
VSAVAGRLESALVFALPIIYIASGIAVAVVRPHTSHEHSFLDAGLYFLNFIFCLLPVMAVSGATISTTAIVPIAIPIFLLPVIATFVCFARRKRRAVATPDELEDIEAGRYFNGDGPNDGDAPGTWTPISPSSLATLGDALRTEERGRPGQPLLDGQEERQIAVHRRSFPQKMDKMYEMLDLLLDGHTIDLINWALNVAMLAATVAIGWYAGVLMGQDAEEHFFDDYACS